MLQFECCEKLLQIKPYSSTTKLKFHTNNMQCLQKLFKQEKITLQELQNFEKKNHTKILKSQIKIFLMMKNT